MITVQFRNPQPPRVVKRGSIATVELVEELGAELVVWLDGLKGVRAFARQLVAACDEIER